MAVQLIPTEFQRLVRIVQSQPEFSNQADRLNLVTLAFGISGKAESIHTRLNLNGSAMTSAVELVNFLCRFGQVSPGVEALGVFLDQLLLNMGLSDEADFMADLINQYQLNQPPISTAPPSPLPSPPLLPQAASKYIFISYARPQQPIAEQIEAYLSAAGCRVFRDTNAIRVGANWDTTIETALQEATHMVLLLSAASMPYRKEVYREWFYFDQQRRPILPLYVQECTLHSRLYTYNYIDAQTDLPGALARLMSQLT